jgi:DNA-binding response OmpR family regulator
MAGLDILKEFVNKFHSKIPVIVMSALSSENDMISGLNLGAIDYVAKPVKAISLITMRK